METPGMRRAGEIRPNSEGAKEVQGGALSTSPWPVANVLDSSKGGVEDRSQGDMGPGLGLKFASRVDGVAEVCVDACVVKGAWLGVVAMMGMNAHVRVCV